MILKTQGKYDELKYELDSVCNADECKIVCKWWQYFSHLLKANEPKTLDKNGEYEKAELSYNQWVEVGGNPNVWDSVKLAFIYNGLGKEEEALSIMNKCQNVIEEIVAKNTKSSMFYISEHYIQLGIIHIFKEEKEAALKDLSTAVNIGILWGNEKAFLTDPVFKSLWDDPKFKALVKRAQEEKDAIRAKFIEMEERGEIDL